MLKLKCRRFVVQASTTSTIAIDAVRCKAGLELAEVIELLRDAVGADPNREADKW